MEKFTDFLIECKNPAAFDLTIQSIGAVLQQDATQQYVINKDGFYTMRVFGNAGFVKFAIQNQGYGKIIEEIPNQPNP